MFGRLGQVTRHLSRPLPNYVYYSSAAAARAGSSRVTSLAMAAERAKSIIHTAGCIIIGDEVLGGKTVDTNSAYFARFCFSLGITLKRIEVIADDEEEIIEATRRMSANYDFVVTSGGIGPTHDDITYQSIAKAFSVPLTLHAPSFERMKRLSKPTKGPNPKPFDWNRQSPALTAKLRMVQLPLDPARPEDEQVVFVADDLWVPVAVVNGNVYILPGVPSLFERMLEGLRPTLTPRLADPEGKGVYRILFSTPLGESAIAEFLSNLAEKVKDKGIKVGSYPRWGRERNTVTLVGRDRQFMDSLVPEVEKGVRGRRVMVEGEDDTPEPEPMET